MKRILRAPIAALAVLAIIAGGASALAAVKQVPMSPAFAKDLSTLSGTVEHEVFASFTGTTTQEARAAVLRAHDLTVLRDFPGIEVTFATGTIADLRDLATDPAISYLHENGQVEFHNNTSQWAIRNAPARQPALGGPYRKNGDIIDGSDVGVAIIDTGIDGSHPDLTNSTNFKMVCSTPGLVSTENDQCFGPYEWVEVENSDTTVGHGSHVAGIIAGTGAASEDHFTGTAPGVHLYGLSVSDGNSTVAGQGAPFLWIAEALQWLKDNAASQDPPIRVLNNSWGSAPGAYDPNDTINKMANDLIASGMTITWSAGNSGSTAGDSMNPYAKNPTPGLISVAWYMDCVDVLPAANPDGTCDGQESGTRNSRTSPDSSKGTNGSPSTYPDISAPGEWIESACSGGTGNCIPFPAWAPYYTSLSGTSMAAPHVAGAAALLLQANPSLTPAQIEDILEDTAYKFSAGGAYGADPANPDDTSSHDKGHGLLDVQAAFESMGVDKDGFASTPASISITNPTPDQVLAANITAGGAFAPRSNSASGPVTLISGDAGDIEYSGSQDLDSLSVQESATGLTWRVSVRDFADRAPGVNGSIYVNYSVDGFPATSIITVAPTGVVTPSTSASSTAKPTTTTVTGNTITAFVPFTNMGNPGANSPVHNVYVLAYSGNLNDVAPGGKGPEADTKPRRGDAFAVKVTSSPTTPTVQISIDGGAQTPASTSAGSWSFPLDVVSLGDGPHTLTAVVKEGSLTTATATQNFTVDLPGFPAPTVSAPTAGALLNSQNVSIAGTTQPGATVDLAEGVTPVGSALADGTGAWSANVTFGEGTHTVDATATDGVDTSSPTSVTFTVDTLAPALPVITTPLPDENLTSANVSFSGTAEPGAIIKVNEGTELATATADGTGVWSANAVLGNGAHTVTVNATDGAGNVGASATRSFTVTLPGPDAPTIDTPAEGAILNMTTVTFRGWSVPGATLQLKEGGVTFNTSTVYASGQIFTTATLPAGAHAITATATVNGIEGAESAIRSFTIVPDTTAPAKPTITSPAVDSLNGKNVIVTGNAEPASRLKVYDNGVLAGQATTKGNGTFSVAAVFKNGTRSLTATATDSAGNASAATTAFSIRVDTQAPTAYSDSEGAVLLAQNLEGMATDNFGVASVSVRFFTAPGNLAMGTVTATLSEVGGTEVTWSASTEGLAPGRYRAEITAKDTVGLASTPSTVTFTVIG